MRIVELGRACAEDITRYESRNVTSVRDASGHGDAHVYTLYFEPGGRIGRHPAGPAQLFLVVEGSGWVEGGDGERVAIAAGQAARFEPGEHHAKGSDEGMTAVMVQIEEMEET